MTYAEHKLRKHRIHQYEYAFYVYSAFNRTEPIRGDSLINCLYQLETIVDVFINGEPIRPSIVNQLMGSTL